MLNPDRENHLIIHSIIIPTYNEEKRIESTLRKIHEYFESENSGSYEIIVVDDGSQDNTSKIIQSLQQTVKPLKLFCMEKNKGKGTAVKYGVLQSSGSYILFADADNSTPIEEYSKLQLFLKDYEVVVGSRFIPGSNIKRKQPFHRVLLGRLGNIMIRLLLIDGISDTQCGFKAFQNKPAREIFSRIRTERFGFDMELLVIAKRFNYRIKEVPVSWHHSSDSRIRPIKDAFWTLLELFKIKWNLSKKELHPG